MADLKCLHWSFFVKNRIAEIAFYKEILGMAVNRHVEYEEKGAHPPEKRSDRTWSVTSFSYGDELRCFGIQLVFSYNPKLEFTRGNDFTAVTVQSRDVIDRAEAAGYPIAKVKNGAYKLIKSPNGYNFFVLDEPRSKKDPILKIHLTCADEMNVLLYWHCVLGAKYISHHLGHSVVMCFQDYGVKFKFRKRDKVTISSHGCRLTCSSSVETIKEMEQFLKNEELDFSLPLTALDVTENGHVLTMIVKDLDGHEIALIDEDEYAKLPVDETVEEALMFHLRKELISKGEQPMLDKFDAALHKTLERFRVDDECRRRRSFRILGPLDEQ